MFLVHYPQIIQYSLLSPVRQRAPNATSEMQRPGAFERGENENKKRERERERKRERERAAKGARCMRSDEVR